MLTFLRDTKGNVSAVFALALLPMTTLTGAAIDYARNSQRQAALQIRTDEAALAAARLGATEQQRLALVQALFPAGGPSASAVVQGPAITVSASQTVSNAFMGLVGSATSTISAVATAKYAVAGPPICALALNPTASGSISFAGNTSFVAPHCAVYTNSSSASALSIQGSATVQATGYCSVGGVSGTFTPAPQTSCSTVYDPLQALPKPFIGACDKTNLSVAPAATKALSPGVYCKGIDLKGTVTLDPGLYIVKDGALSIGSQANVTVSGSGGVTFYLTGTGASLNMDGSGGVSLTAQTSGPYAGLLIIQDRDSNIGAKSTLNGNSSTVLKGAIYLPTQELQVNGNNSFGQQSGFMPMIADTLSFSGSSTASLDTPMATGTPLPSASIPARLAQ